ncbi:MAG: peroxide stress protein YaaA [Tunicatimonas sp.]
MITLLSPSKTQDPVTGQGNPAEYVPTTPAFLAAAAELVETLQQQSPDELMHLMRMSEPLAALNHTRYQRFSTPFTADNAHPALLTFRGDVYTDIAVDTYGAADFTFAQQHLRILSGLYGLLRPLDLIQPYRLEMSTTLPTGRGTNLYQFWGDRLTEHLNEVLAEQPHAVVVNLASQEYFKAIHPKKLAAPVVTPVFKEYKNGQLKTVAIYAKRARGKMTNFIIKNRIDAPEQLKTFSEDRYEYHEVASTDTQWVFVR